MKKYFNISAVIIGLLLLSMTGCTKKEKSKCTEWYESEDVNFGVASFVDISAGVAKFKFEVDISNVCVFEYAKIYITVTEHPGAVVSAVTAYALLPNSTAPDINIKYIDSGLWQSDRVLLNLKQSFSKNPGYYTVRVYIYFNASTQSEAIQKYGDYIYKIEVSNQVYRPADDK